MKKIAPRLLALLLGLAALLSSAPKVEAARACNLLCIIDFHCCIERGQPTCIPNSQACHGN